MLWLLWKTSPWTWYWKLCIGLWNGSGKIFLPKEFTSTEELVAGSPEYAFNEYLQIAVEYGVLFLLVVLLIIVFCLWIGITEKRLSACAGLISVSICIFILSNANTRICYSILFFIGCLCSGFFTVTNIVLYYNDCFIGKLLLEI